MWVCGLKPGSHVVAAGIGGVAPYVGVWIETAEISGLQFVNPSHPMWVCGLKRMWSKLKERPKEVAPYVGVWIETHLQAGTAGMQGRTLCGCVD